MNELDNILAKITQTEEEPTSGHFERFGDKIRKREHKRVFNLLLKAAAILVLAYLSTELYLSVNLEKRENQILAKSEKEIKDAGIYYTIQINNEMKEVKALIKEGAGSEKDLSEVRKEFSEMDNQFQNLKRDYQSNPADERLQNAIIQYYQSKLEIVNTIKNDMENVKQQKLKYYENNKI